MSHKINTEIAESCVEWLNEFGASPSDVLFNSNGDLFIKVEDEEGYKTVYLPRQFQELDFEGSLILN